VRQVATRLLQAMRFERDAYVWMEWTDRATGDAAILVLVTRLVIQLGLGGGLSAYVDAVISAFVFWLVYSGIVYAATRFLFQAGGGFAPVLRLSGFAYPTLILLLATAFLDYPFDLLLGSLWFLAIVTSGMRHIAELPIEKAFGAAAAGLVGFVIVSQILGFGF
jgi:hypothetical protein